MYIEDESNVPKVVTTIIAGVGIIKFDTICYFANLTYP